VDLSVDVSLTPMKNPFNSCSGGAVIVSGANEHWVGTWATAVVIRPQAPRSTAGRAAPLPPSRKRASANASRSCAFGPPSRWRAGWSGGPLQAEVEPARLRRDQLQDQTLREIRARLTRRRFASASSEHASARSRSKSARRNVALRDKDAAIKAGSDCPLTFGGNAATMMRQAPSS